MDDLEATWYGVDFASKMAKVKITRLESVSMFILISSPYFVDWRDDHNQAP